MCKGGLLRSARNDGDPGRHCERSEAIPLSFQNRPEELNLNFILFLNEIPPSSGLEFSKPAFWSFASLRMTGVRKSDRKDLIDS